MTDLPSRLLPCTDCGREISVRAQACPYCGAPPPRPARPQPVPGSGSPASGARGWMMVGAVVLGGVALFVLKAVFLPDAPIGVQRSAGGLPPGIVDRRDAVVRQCNAFALERLKAPSSADFPTSDTRVSAMGDERYIMVAHVDSQNSFGAKLRTRFACEVKFLGGGSDYDRSNWQLLSLAFDDS